MKQVEYLTIRFSVETKLPKPKDKFTAVALEWNSKCAGQ